ncbi:hypothetical protein M8756_03265 [Lutimaribacter sp. EGI FJ00015]|uniref:Uncharacterized protein n=1 Tax=Lutimaribacter degradans TaxID=2945989 RepID=A0ACC5ZQY9_9RHOB|nr:hypothetical protein [Lutimaribacter sp. EGI FJ00013]MCM2560737.1 hypothetical protein [Lutimaribacter sp. EGI FJ00013]MCO0612317.1 hypothetical protein [Lutimaribacter sp. EGI FJ00015]MCO0634562.1 hypothetical protein [Lutimaribacter sp. EGI FJ00014]
MATISTNNTKTSTIRNPLAALGAALLNWMENYADTKTRRAEIEALSAKTDAELAEMGLRRDRIAHYVFRDLYYV